MDARRARSLAIGGAAGATTRWLLLEAFPPPTFPWPVLLANVIGCLVLGLATADRAAIERLDERARVIHHGVTIGFCGGLTTASTVAVEVVELGRDGDGPLGALYLAASLVAGLTAVAIGLAVGRHRPVLRGGRP